MKVVRDLMNSLYPFEKADISFCNVFAYYKVSNKTCFKVFDFNIFMFKLY